MVRDDNLDWSQRPHTFDRPCQHHAVAFSTVSSNSSSTSNSTNLSTQSTTPNYAAAVSPTTFTAANGGGRPLHPPYSDLLHHHQKQQLQQHQPYHVTMHDGGNQSPVLGLRHQYLRSKCGSATTDFSSEISSECDELQFDENLLLTPSSTSSSSAASTNSAKYMTTSPSRRGKKDANFGPRFNIIRAWTKQGFKRCNIQNMVAMLLCLVFFTYITQFHAIQHRFVTVEGWGLNTSRDAALYIRPDEYTARIEPRTVGAITGIESQPPRTYLLIIIVCSAINKFATRQVIRETWANSSEFNYGHFDRMHGKKLSAELLPNIEVLKQLELDLFGGPQGNMTVEQLIKGLTNRTQVLFLVGRDPEDNNDTQQQLVEESNEYGDVIQEDFMDTYNNLTLKSIMLLKWIDTVQSRGQVRTKYVMKCDDDTFLNVPNLVHSLLGGIVPLYSDTIDLYTSETIQHRQLVTAETMDQYLLSGHLFQHSKVIRDNRSKWFAPRYMYIWSTYPNYLSGTGYLMSSQTAKVLYQVALRTTIFHLEDVFITGLCAGANRQMAPRHNPLFSFQTMLEKQCSMRGMITQHPMTVSDIKQQYELIMDEPKECSTPSADHLLWKISALFNSQSMSAWPSPILILVLVHGLSLL